MKYINSYNEGFYELGIASFAIWLPAPYQQSYSELYPIAIKQIGFRGLWAANALCKLDINYESLFNRADTLRHSGLISLAYEEMKKAHQMDRSNLNCIAELIKLCAMKSDYTLGRDLLQRLPSSYEQDEKLRNSIQFLKG